MAENINNMAIKEYDMSFYSSPDRIVCSSYLYDMTSMIRDITSLFWVIEIQRKGFSIPNLWVLEILVR